jgi:hypothetical protein
VTKREIVGVTLIVIAFGLTPFAYSASIAVGIVATLIGLAGLLLFAIARPWRSSNVEPDQYVEPRKVPLGLAMHDLEHAVLMGSAHDPAHGGLSEGGGAHSGDSGGGGGDAGAAH